MLFYFYLNGSGLFRDDSAPFTEHVVSLNGLMGMKMISVRCYDSYVYQISTLLNTYSQLCSSVRDS